MPLSEREDYIDQILGLLDTASATASLMGQIKRSGKTPKGIHLKPERAPIVAGERATDMYVTRSVRGDTPGKPWRVSYFNADKPLAHSNHSTLENALRYVDMKAAGFSLMALQEYAGESKTPCGVVLSEAGRTIAEGRRPSKKTLDKAVRLYQMLLRQDAVRPRQAEMLQARAEKAVVAIVKMTGNTAENVREQLEAQARKRGGIIPRIGQDL